VKETQSWLFFALLCVVSVLCAIWLRGGTDATPFAIVSSWFEDEYQAQPHAKQERPALLSGKAESKKHSEHRASAPQPSGATYRSASSYPREHTSDDSEVCNRPPTKNRSNTESQVYYRWIDEEGQTHLADKRPPGQVASVVSLGVEAKDFTYEIESDGVSVPVGFPGQLAAGSKRIYDTWHFLLGEEKLRQSKISLKLIGGPERFDAYYAKVAPGRKPVNGFYSMSNNTAVVKFDPSNVRRALATTFHETSHLITASHLGPTPPWLTEGLAEYFETMQVREQSGAIHPNYQHLNLLTSTQLPRLQDYLAITRPEWHGDERDRNYAIAWSLVNFLMTGAPGMYALQETIQQVHANFCKPFSAENALGQAYPGGFKRLEADWRKWLAAGNHKIQQI